MDGFLCRDAHLNRENSPSSESSAYELAYDLTSRSRSTTPDGHESHHQVKPPRLCDARLEDLNIRRWTDVDIDSDKAAKCISLYLETDHPLLGHFEPDLFVSDLTAGQTEYCSSLLVNALLYWACVSQPANLKSRRLVTAADSRDSKCTVLLTQKPTHLQCRSVLRRKNYGTLSGTTDVTLF